VVYESNESGEFEIYVKRFPSGEGKWQVSIDGGEYPEWGKSGDTIYYRGDGWDIYEVSCKTEDNLVLGTPVKIVDCDKSGLVSGGFKSYTVAGDGERVIMMQAVTTNRNTIDVGITVVQNWPLEFAARDDD